MPQRAHTLICFDAPQALYWQLRATIPTLQKEYQEHAYGLHVKVVEGLLELYDQAIWSLRDTVRDMEIVRAFPHPTTLRLLRLTFLEPEIDAFPKARLLCTS